MGNDINKFDGAYLASGGLSRFIPEPKSRLGLDFGSVIKGVGSLVGSVTGGTLGVGAGGIPSETQALLDTQYQLQLQLQNVTMVSNTLRTEHEMEMTPLRNLKLG